VIAKLRRFLPLIALLGTVASAVLFAIQLPGHADRGSWGDLWETGRHHVSPVLLLLLVSFFVRGRTSFGVAAAWFGGYFLSIGLAFVVLGPTGDWLGDDARWQSSVMVPVFEELFKAIPLLLVYLGARNSARMKLTVTDFTLLGLAAGGGFAFHEDALLTRVISSGWDGWGVLFPAVVQDPIFAAGHGVWTGLVGLGLGLALARRGRSFSWLPFVLALAVVVLDHGLVNDGADRWLLLDGRLPVYLLAAGIAITLFVETRAIAGGPEGTTPFRSWVGGELRDVAAARGARAKVAGWQDFMLWLRLHAQMAWYGHTEFGADGARSSSPKPGDAKRQLIASAAVVVVVIGVAWVLGRDAANSDPADTAAEETSDEPTDETDQAQEADEADTGSAADATPTSSPPVEFGEGPVFDGAVYLRWSYEDDRGPQAGTVLLVDGDRELHNDSYVLQFQYHDGGEGVLCFGVEGESMICVAESPTERLTNRHFRGPIDVPDLPGVEVESRTFVGREATCVKTPSLPGNTYIRICTDLGSGLVVLTESESELLAGGTSYQRRELVEWSIPTEDDWELPAPALDVLNE
jgi:RsiW-degrading membrane proteinase PrsW (M82 family)